MKKVEKHLEWQTVVSILEYGLELKYKGHTLRVKAEHFDKTPAEIRRDLVENEDYFTSEETLKKYAYEKYGWVGPKDNEFSPVLGRRRAAARPQQSPSSGQMSSHKKQKREAKNINSGVTKSQQIEKKVSNKIPNQISLAKKTVAKQVLQSKSKGKGNTENTENTKPVATMKERLAECTKCLDASFAPQNMLFDGENSTSNFAATRERILSFLQNCSSNLNDGTRPRYASVLYICGRPGTGKVRL